MIKFDSEVKIKSIIKDENNESTYSVLTEISAHVFKSMIKEYKWTEGNQKIAQRKFITGTQKSRLVQKRLQKDIELGSILPPIVMGLIDEDFDGNQIKDDTEGHQYIISMLKKCIDYIFILDGVQRCNNIVIASKIKNINLRIEWWITKKIDIALDRMLILNFAQTPWDSKQQSKAILSLFKKADDYFEDFSEGFKTELEKEPHKFLECLFSFKQGKNNVFIKDEVSSVFLKEKNSNNPTKEILDNFGIVYKIAQEWSKYLVAEHSVRVGICLALADIISTDKQIDESSKYKLNILDKWLSNLEELGKNRNEVSSKKSDTANYLAYTTLKECYGKIKSAIGISSREMFRYAFKEIFINIIAKKGMWANPTESDDTLSEIQEEFGDIWENAYNQIGSNKKEE